MNIYVLQALLRRFTRTIDIGNPSLADRIAIIDVHISKLLLDPQLDKDPLVQRMAKLSSGMTGRQQLNLEPGPPPPSSHANNKNCTET